jgi:phage terminase large subunit GpA-like protein
MGKVANQKDQISSIFDFTESTTSIICGVCKAVSTYHNLDEFMSCEAFWDDGWRIFRDKCYCPKCVKAKLKKIKI